VVAKSNGGLSSARNAGIGAASGRFLAFLDADDHWLPAKLSRQVALMDANADIGFCSTAARVEDPDGRVLNIWECPEVDGDLLQHLFHENAAVAGSGSGVMVRREILDLVGTFDESLRSLEDIDMWMRLAAVTGYRCIPEPLTVLQKHPDGMSRNLEVMRFAAMKVMRKNRSLLPPELRGGYWRAGLAGVHADFAKWRYRNRQPGRALLEVLHVLALSPMKRGRLALGLLRDIVLAKPL
jgi:glycosyltransferase involved in cell wall biosynthesis